MYTALALINILISILVLVVVAGGTDMVLPKVAD
jgi:hypothetical protein